MTCSAVGLSAGTVDAICQRALGRAGRPARAAAPTGCLTRARCTSMRPAGEPPVTAGRCGPLTTPSAALFQIAQHCNREEFQALVGPYPGSIVLRSLGRL